MKKIVVYGAGQIGTCVMAELALHAPSDAVEVVMYAPHNHQRVLGAKLDLDDAAVMKAQRGIFTFVLSLEHGFRRFNTQKIKQLFQHIAHQPCQF